MFNQASSTGCKHAKTGAEKDVDFDDHVMEEYKIMGCVAEAGNSHLSHAKACCFQVFFNMLHFVLHLRRMREITRLVHKRMYSDSEFNYLPRNDKNYSCGPALNYFVWRRSALYVLTVAMCVIAAAAGLHIINMYTEPASNANAYFELDFEKWQDAQKQECGSECWDVQFTFTQYSKEYLRHKAEQYIEELNSYARIKQVVAAVFKVLACLLTWRSACLWASWKRSAKWLSWAWVCVFLVALVPTMIPIQAVTKLDSLSDDFAVYMESTALHFDLKDEAMEAVSDFAELCQSLKSTKRTVTAMKRDFSKFCSMLPRINVLVVDTRGAKDGCTKTDKQISEDELKTHFDSMISTCEDVRHKTQGLFGRNADLYGFVQTSLTNAQASFAILLGMCNAAYNVKVIWPAALSVGPGLLAGAIRAKIIVPESCLPGVFMMILPWLYVPLSWAIFNIVVQLTGDWMLLGCTLLITFSPLLVSFVASWKAMNRPMTRKRLLQLTKWISRAQTVALVIATGLFFGFVVVVIHAYQDFISRHAHLLGEMLQLFLETEALPDMNYHELFLAVVQMVASLITKYVLTSIAATDWILEQTANTEARTNSFMIDQSALNMFISASSEKLDHTPGKRPGK
eukprot:TRINITY_DN10401_c0_g1_i1.p1 TRINITY_DN10401_c0_g1~~TRINITY_DN10401_c0_g1_i1.p1  ORF type:complete len:626 (-),score=106.82 TRINITY_DN10401_c0_g1_i1:22-1899(-)